jgi:hypothetical protein
MNAFVDAQGRWQDVYVVLGLEGSGTGPPTDAESAVISFYASQPNVRAVHVDTTPVTDDFSGTPVAKMMPGAPYAAQTLPGGSSSTLTLMHYKTQLGWELLLNTTAPYGHEYDMLVRLRPDLYLPTYAWQGKAVNLDEFSAEATVRGARWGDTEEGAKAAAAAADPTSAGGLMPPSFSSPPPPAAAAPNHRGPGTSVSSLGCTDRLYYRSWGPTDEVLPGIHPYQAEVTGGQASLLIQHSPPEGAEVRATLFFSFYAICCGGVNDYHVWGKLAVMREYLTTAGKLDEVLLPPSKLRFVPEAVKKYSLLLGLRKQEVEENRAAKSLLLEVRPCDRAVYCLAKWYPNGDVDPDSCPRDLDEYRWKANADAG